ncbi:polyribonucleotide nucleotidyltransferase [Candidatus Woesebacteria bacterium]|nr:polyribonucleotide nucleotidyltransferase [Candidatus Woesebacteria bacterium]
MKIVVEEIKIGGQTLTLEHGRFASFADSAVVARLGDTMVLVTVVASQKDTDLDYFPLTVDYFAKLYAGGKIKGSRWVKRDGRPTDDEILTARLTDRSIRPLFPKAYKKDVQVIATVLSVDGENDPSTLAMIGASAALATSSIPWSGPVASLKIGTKDGKPVANPTNEEMKTSDLELVLSTSKDSIFMIEAGANQVSEKKVLEAVEFGQKEAQKIIKGISELAKKIGVEKQKVEDKKDKELIHLIDKKFGSQLYDFAKANSAKDSVSATEIEDAIIEEVGKEKAGLVSGAIEEVTKNRIRKETLAGKRLDGRKLDQIREISVEVGVLPRTHGSAVFQRGQTQALTIATLGSPDLSQLLETAEGEENKHYIHHYNMPPFTTGETGRVGSPGRREIGHGALAERALIPVLPKQEDFPYTIQVVSEIMASNGSTSMASTCGSTLSLMDAGVPISAPVAGIAMGLIIEDKKTAILSDILGTEDFTGDMDFKVAGTKDGVTAIQLDVKTASLTFAILEKALKQANTGRLFILSKMTDVVDKPREDVSKYAPSVIKINIPVEKIGEIIGPGGRQIKDIMATTGAHLDVEDDGSVVISGPDKGSVSKAQEYVENLIKEVQPGEVYEGEVKRIQPFGAFVEVLPGKDGLVHVSDMSEGFVKDPNDVVKEGDKVQVRVKEIDQMKRINLTMILDPEKEKEKESGSRDHRGGDRGDMNRRDDNRRGDSRRGDSRGGRRDNRFSPRGRGSQPQRGRSENERSGPHFPASRLVPSKRRF